MVIQEIDGISYKLREEQDFSWISDYGRVFSVIDETGSGCIMFGVKSERGKLFFKIAGAKTVEAEVTQEESIRLLKEAVVKYQDIHDENLIRYIDSFLINDCFAVIYEYAEGECLFDHWNFERYKREGIVETPKYRFRQLPVEKRLSVIEKLFSFFENVITAGYAAVDFYDSSIIYDFYTDKVTFCDIDLFRKLPAVNDAGTGYFGTKRLKAPEENELGAVIDEKTNEFTLGAIIFDMLSDVKNNKSRYELGMFIPNSFKDFELDEGVYDVLCKATSYNRDQRYKTITEFHEEFERAIKK
ncbi:MAG: serine/threonine protein kinase [Erysipelotrichaceae bacterium]|nr:serine/threonine protein kinase [Erysipelotrichaceae bacterium]